MDSRDDRNRLQCLVDEGTLINRRDMVRILRDLGQVRYQELVDGALTRQGEGLIVNVVSSESASTIVVNKRLYLNVNGFDHMQLGCDEAGGSTLDLVSEGRTLRLIPVTDPITDQTPVVTVDTVAAPRTALDRIFGESFAEVYLDDEDDSDDD